ncbi:hypothetical protein AWZ03_010473 [Drosophila navojoa]|uniref:SUEL-type lectin domain-containing protein n=1 Tax=Drosophila navojoa TaxID=7232 RepID=A0A484B2S4_DRONA|nr:uncharacterized protein LOC115563833 [Drosophila navojoa]XP_030243246.1 uncharacterized protein LOC115563833 [Drosophila navojoa]XP_030243247.1 uncharacterized protein LOC115563833 [Drosophila navojoa]TDG43116.1 hypothetical protein AWZ03_010473 [Drosophila navojoa]
MDYTQAKCLMLSFLCALSAASAEGEIIFRIDPLALLSATLRTYQKAACDTDQVVIACPRGTSISIEFAQYNKFVAKDGYSIEELCPVTGTVKPEIRGKAKHLLRGSIFGSTTQKVPANRYVNNGYAIAMEAPSSTNGPNGPITESTADDAQKSESSSENCMWPNALQYSLLQTVVEACQKKKHCKFHGSPQFYGLGASGVGDSSGTSSYHSSTASSNAISSDPCPKRRKIVEIAYKCRPYEFRSKVACHNDVAQLECNPYSRIAVYSASFGRTEYESIQCPQPQGVREETCLASFATETVMQICHGRRRCNLAADANTFGTPCQPNSRMYLKVVYTCVPKQVLKESNESEVEADETEDFEGDINDLYDDELIYKESEAIPKLYSNTTKNSRGNATGGAGRAANSNPEGIHTATNGSLDTDADGSGVNPVMTHSADLSLEDDQQRLYLYLLIVGLVGVLCSIVVVVARLLLQKRRMASDTHSNSSTKGGTSGGLGDETTIPSGFNDTISEIDADIDLTTSIPLPSVSKNENYITYAPASSLYASLAPSQLSSVGGPCAAPALIPNPLLMGARQSPDLIGIAPSTYVATSSAGSAPSAQAPMTGILAPAIVIGANGPGGALPGSSGINTMVPLTSLAQYTTAPTIRGGYIINTEGMGVVQRPANTPTPPASLASGSPAHPQTQQTPTTSPLAMATLSHLPAAGTSTLRRTKPAAAAMLHPQLSYDGTAPRTLSTGLPVSSQFYYG